MLDRTKVMAMFNKLLDLSRGLFNKMGVA